MLSQEQKTKFDEQGFLILPHFKNAAQIAALRERAEALVEAFDPAAQRAIFTTQEQERNVDDYFLDSDDKMRCFFEEEAFDAQGRLRQAKALSINKIGHAMHDLDPVFREFSSGPALAAVARDVGLSRPQVWQSMYIFKQPGIGGEVRWHQDASFFDSDPITVTTFWFALEDATRDNGCLWAEPGGHRGPRGVLRERFVREGRRAWMETLDETPWPSVDALAEPLEVEAGALVLFHGLLPHYSAPNRSAHSRHAYTLHVTDAASTYSPRNWLQRGPQLPVRGF
ncbi:phytanoyl-CoA dioxygenase family protein [Paucibacter sp. PLA-PC-4]|uniref:phytanoyl-CoA dioxygenase family protein n=1 Tax=Paucibacter sp. PLA-PC-4 TaxID=2993655 RepID=UPI0022495C6F|nr:phytanoyl-CoA dioxygenase family protein [Paucibacter sp. PLA-PC-4]MCX2863037.1 phytanoyl-CoA dioxygenase family protein [Paucibacter sp. PLA-PC-4]